MTQASVTAMTGGGVEDDEVSPFAQQGYEFSHPGGAEELGRIRGDGTAGQDGEVLYAGVVDEFDEGRAVGEEVGDAAVARQAEDLVLHRASQVAVHDDDSFPGLGKGDGGVGRGERFAFQWSGAGEHDGFQFAVRFAEADVGPQGAVGFGHRGF